MCEIKHSFLKIDAVFIVESTLVILQKYFFLILVFRHKTSVCKISLALSSFIAFQVKYCLLV